LREESLVAVGRIWVRSDPETARSWLEQRGLSAEAWAQIGAR